MNLNKLNNLNLKTKAQILISLYVLSAILLIYFYILPTATSIESIKTDIFTEKVAHEKKLNREKNYASLGSKVKEIEPQMGILENIYINVNRKLEFITTLEGAAADSDVEQKLNLNLKFNSDGTAKKVPLIIDLNGSYPAIMDYLIAIETIPYYININFFSLNLSSPAKEEIAFDRYNLRLNANTYWK